MRACICASAIIMLMFMMMLMLLMALMLVVTIMLVLMLVIMLMLMLYMLLTIIVFYVLDNFKNHSYNIYLNLQKFHKNSIFVNFTIPCCLVVKITVVSLLFRCFLQKIP